MTGLPADSDAEFTLTVTPFSQDGGAAAASGAAQTIRIVVDAVADTPTLSAANAIGDEDQPIAIPVVAALGDGDGSESVGALRLTGVPTGSTLTFLSGGATLTLSPTSSAGGFDVYDVTGAQATSLRIQAPANFSGTIVLGATLTAIESAVVGADEINAADNTSSAIGNITITVNNVSDEPGLFFASEILRMKEDLGADPGAFPPPNSGPAFLPITVTPGVAGETPFIVISGVPAGVSFNAAGQPSTLVPGGLLFTAAEALALRITGLPEDSDRDFTLTVTPFSQDGSAPPRVGTSRNIAVTVDAVADTPTLGFTVTGVEDSAIALNLATALGDTDGSEVISQAIISGLPAGYSLVSVAGGVTTTLTPGAGGVFTVAESAIAGLQVIPQANASGTVTLNVTVTARETIGPSNNEITNFDNTRSASGTIVLTITPVSDPPSLSAPALVVGKEDVGAASAGAGDANTTGGFATPGAPSGAIALPIVVTPGAPGETAFVEIAGIPPGMSFNLPGTAIAPGTLRFTAADAANLSIVALPSGSDADVTLTVTPFSQDGTAAPAVGAAQTLVVRVDAVADVPLLAAPFAINVSEDATTAAGTQRIALPISTAPGDGDGSENLTLVVSGLPVGLSLTGATFDAASGNWLVPNGAIAGLQIVAPLHFAGGFTLGVTAVATESASGVGEPDGADNVATRFQLVPVTIAAIPDAPTLNVAGQARGFEDSFIALTIGTSLVDGDGSETLAIRLDGVPTGATLRSGATTLTPLPDGSYALTVAQLAALQVRPPLDSNEDFVIGVTATATEASNGTVASASAQVTVSVVGVADPGMLVSAGATPEDSADASGGRVPLNIFAGISDSDAAAGRAVSETVTAIVLSGLPAGFTLSRGLITAINPDGSTSWTLKRIDGSSTEWDSVELVGWPTHLASTLSLAATVVTTENDGDTEATAFTSFPIVVAPVVDDFDPTGSASGLEDQPIAIAIAPGLVDADGSERIVGNVTLSSVPSGVTISAGGVSLAPTSPGIFVVSPSQLATLTAQAPLNSNVDFTLGATMTIAEFDGANNPIAGQSRTEVFTVPVTVIGDADSPGASAAAVAGNAGTTIDTSLGGTLADVDGSERLYFIVSGVPQGMGLKLGPAAAPGDVLLNLGEGRWLANQGAIADVQLRTAIGFAGAGTSVVPLTLSAVSEENVSAVSEENDGAPDRAETTTVFNVTISPNGGGGGGGGDGGNPGGPGEALTVALTGSAGSDEDTPAPVLFGLSGVPNDASAAFIIRAASLPPGARVISTVAGSIYVDPATGDHVVPNDPAVLAGLSIVPPLNFSGTIQPTVSAVVTFADGSVSTAQINPQVTIAPVADPIVLGASGSGGEDTLVKVNINAAVTDTDGSESVTQIRIAGLSSGATLVDGAGNPLPQTGGVHTIANPDNVFVRAPQHFSGVVAFTVEATSQDVAGATTVTRVSSAAASVTVIADADAPVVSGPALIDGLEDLGAALAGAGRITVTPIDADGSEVFSVVVRILATPAGVLPTDVRLSAGVNNGDGSWTLTQAEFAGASLTLPAGAAGDVAIRVVGNALELSNSDTAAGSADFTVRIQAVADAPSLSVAASVSGSEDSPVVLPIDASLIDVDGSESLLIRLDGVPSGASFGGAGSDLGGGSWRFTPAEIVGLSFTPPADDFGVYNLTVVATANEAGGGNPGTAATTQAMQVTITDVVDVFSGGPGGESLTGTKGADILEGKGGSDTLTGGLGGDRFVYGADAISAADVITDFAAGDTLALGPLLQSLGGAPAQGDAFFRFVQSGANVELRVDQNGAAAGDTNTLLATIQNQVAAQVRSQTDFS